LGFAEGGGSQFANMGQSQDNHGKGKTNFSLFYLFKKIITLNFIFLKISSLSL
jgi:hypothetical protein